MKRTEGPAHIREFDSCDDELSGESAAEAELLISEDGEARRRFLKQALLVGGGIAAANLLFQYQQSAVARPLELNSVPVSPDPSQTLAIALRVNGKDYSLQLEPQVTLLDALRERIGLSGSKKAAIGASVAPAQCWLTAIASIPASHLQPHTRAARLLLSKV
jgi:hypothetical protein